MFFEASRHCWHSFHLCLQLKSETKIRVQCNVNVVQFSFSIIQIFIADKTVVAIATTLLARLSLQIYNSYQKRGTLSRDTLHRFLSDVHGEDSLKGPYAKGILDAMFSNGDAKLGGSAAGEKDSAGNKPGHVVEKQYKAANVSAGGSHPQQQATSATTAPKKVLIHLNATQYTHAVHATLNNISPEHPAPATISHLLLDWLISLGNSMLPSPPSTAATSSSKHSILYYHNKMEAMDPSKAISNLCTQYKINQNVMYEVKRRYHSIVNIREFDEEDENKTTSKDDNDSNNKSEGEDEEEEEHHLPFDEEEGQADRNAAAAFACQKTTTSSSSSPHTKSSTDLEKQVSDQNNKPRNVIEEASFLKAVCKENEEMGTGGFLTHDLAVLTFRNGCDRIWKWRSKQERMEGYEEEEEDGVEDMSKEEEYSEKEGEEEGDDDDGHYYWTMYDALAFGCDAIRGDVLTIKDAKLTGKDAELRLLKFVFETFTSLPSLPEEEKKRGGEKVMTRYQIGQMLLLLMDHATFRLQMARITANTIKSLQKYQCSV